MHVCTLQLLPISSVYNNEEHWMGTGKISAISKHGIELSFSERPLITELNKI